MSQRSADRPAASGATRVGARAVAAVLAVLAVLTVRVDAQPPGPTRAAEAVSSPTDAPRGDDGGAPPSAGTLFSTARAAERDFDFVSARDAYGRLLVAHPTHRLVSRARRRITWIDARATSASELARLGELMRWRGSPASASAISSRAAEIARWPAGRLRREGHAALAHAALRLGAPRLAVERARAYVAEVEGDRTASESERFESLQLLARALGAGAEGASVAATGEGTAEGPSDQARADELDALLEGPLAGSVLAEARVDARRRARGRSFVSVALAIWALLLLALLGRALRPAPAARLVQALKIGLRAVVLPAVVLLGPTLIASAYNHDASDTFWLLWPALVGVLGPSYVAFAALAPDARRERGALGAATVLALGGAAYLVLLTRGLAVLGLGA